MITPRHFDTRAVHSGQAFDPSTGAVIPPIYQTSTYVQEHIGGLRGGYEYSRAGNPTRTALEDQLAALEGANFGLVFASGLSAEDALLRATVQPGDHVIVGNDVYGGTHRLLSRIYGTVGVEITTVDTSDTDAVRAAIRPGRTRVLWIETPSNPLMKISDIVALAELGRSAGAVVVVDNTFATPALQQPLRLGADVIVHSTTKYLGGHSDVIGGAVITDDAELAEKVRFIQFAAGAVAAPMEAFLTTRGVKTLALRMRKHSENASAIAELLSRGHDDIVRVYYPGLADHPGHERAARQMSAFGGMVSLELRSEEKARAFAESTVLFQLAESLGGVESLVCHPAMMTHASVRGTEVEIPPSVVRLSVGIEDVRDLLDDIEQTLARL